LRKDYLDICDGHHGAALLLGFFVYWHDFKLQQRVKNIQANDIAEKHGDPPGQDVSLYQFHNKKQIYDGLLGLVGKQAIEDGIKLLVKKSFISVHKNPNPRYSFDSTRHFLIFPDEINQSLGRTKLGWSATQNGTTVDPKWYDGRPKMVRTSPEITSKITKERELLTAFAENEDEISSPIPEGRKQSSAGRAGDFEKFWQAYPRKVGKGGAERAWQKIHSAPALETIILAIRDQQAWRDTANGAFRPDWKHPATWLNQRCWEDQVDMQVEPPPRPRIKSVKDGMVTLTDGSVLTKADYEREYQTAI
jgi:hypothetical protein